tara:strand:- start:2262 stop:3320 length:1059 start_codon:yes stop_codon:yes gene_type:complete
VKAHRLGDIATQFELELRGDADTRISGACSLNPGKAGCISYMGSSRLAEQLPGSLASAIVVTQKFADAVTGAALIARDPGLAFARIARLFDRDRAFEPGVHPTASVAPDALVGEGVHLGAGAVVGRGAQIGAHSFIGPNCVIGDEAVLGEHCRLVASVSIGNRVVLGARCQVQPGAVIGSRGFGNVMGPEGWEEIPQLGSVIVGDDVEIGAHTCIDRGALEDTIISKGVRLDNLIQIAHNCHIGEHTAIAACVGVAGSTRIGARCMIGGQAGFNGHLQIGDDVVVLGSAMVTKSLPDKGIYGSGIPVESVREWRRMVARVRRLQTTEDRVRELEKQLGIKTGDTALGDAGDE